jgi:hypothetical protein
VPGHAIDAGPIAEAPISDRECNALLDHAVTVGVAEQRAAKPPELVASDDAQAKLRADLAGELAGCRALPREAYRCALAAATLDALAACQASLSSSTSNNSVAPGGILPPAAPVAP